MKISRVATAVALALLSVAAMAGTASAGKPTPPPATATTTWTGNGTTVAAEVRSLDVPGCDANSTPYLDWVLSGSKATSATIDLGAGAVNMGRPGVDKKTGISTFKYTWSPGTAIDLDALLVIPVTATYSDAKNKATLTIGTGCLGSGASPLTITFLGNNTGSAYTALGAFVSVRFCESTNATNCVTFTGSAAGASQTLTLGTSPSTLVIQKTSACEVLLFTSAVSAASYSTLNASKVDISAFNTNPKTTTTTWSNGSTLYWVHDYWQCD